MEKARYRALMDDEGLCLTREESDAGWHFCAEYDGLLVGPGMPELQICGCLRGGDDTGIQASSDEVV